MSRYEVLKRLDNYQYTEGCPVFITGGNLLKDTQAGKIFIQLRFKNNSAKEIAAVIISVKCMDIEGEELEGIGKFRYLDLNAACGSTFGDQQTVSCPDSDTRKCIIDIVKVIFTDETQWKCPENSEKIVFGLQERLTEWKNSRYIPYLRTEMAQNGHNVPNTVYVPKIFGDHWICTCGAVNRSEEKCACCGSTAEDLMPYFEEENIEVLKEKIREEQLRRKMEAEENERRAQEERNKVIERLNEEDKTPVKKDRDFIISVASIAAGIVILALFFIFVYE